MTETSRPENLIDIEPTALSSRKLTLETCRKYGYGIGEEYRKTVQVADYRRKGEVVAQHVRLRDKSFHWINYSNGLELFGQHLWEEGGKTLIITEGELDCLSWAQTRQLKWPVVAVPGVGSIKLIKANLKWLSTFKEIILYFDEDEPGQEFAIEVASLLPAGRVKIGHTAPYKDANEMLVAEGSDALYKTLWQSKTWRPQELLTFDEALTEDAGSSRDVFTGLPVVDELTGGLSPGELVMVGAGSNIGKSELLRQIATSIAIGGIKGAYFPLEEGPGRVAQAIKSIHGVGIDDLTFFKPTGDDLCKSILRNIEYLAVAEGVRVIFIDHVTSIFNQMRLDVSGIDSFMQELQALAARVGVIVFYNSHVRDPQHGSYELGLIPTSDTFRGSGMLYRIPDVVLVLGRAITDSKRKYETTLRCIKHRWVASLVGEERYYTIEDGRLVATVNSEEEATEDDGFNDDF